MAKSASKELFYLIKSLTKSEKRYFKLLSAAFSENSSENKYLLLFNAIDKQEEYEEDEIKKKVVAIKDLPKLKERLQANIMKSLRLFNTNFSIVKEIRESLNDIQILFDKGLYLQCRKTTDKALALAKKYELDLYTIELINWKMTIKGTFAFSEIEKAELEDIHAEINALLYRLKNTQLYVHLNQKFAWASAMYGVLNRDESELQEFNNIVNHEVLRDEKKAIGFVSKSLFYTIHGIYNSQITMDDFQSHIYLRKLLELMESSVIYIESRPLRYVNTLKGLLICYSRLKEHALFEEVLEKIKNIYSNFRVKKKKIIDQRIFEIRSVMEMDFYINTGKFEKINDIIDYIEPRLSSNIMIQNQVAIYINAAYMYFAIGEYKKSLYWINKIPEVEIIPYDTIRYFYLLTRLLIHYELNNVELLPYLTRSTYRFLYKRKKLSGFDEALLSFIRKQLPGVNSKQKLIQAFMLLQAEMDIIFKDPVEKRILEHFDFVSWIKSKTEDRPFIDIVREKINN